MKREKKTEQKQKDFTNTPFKKLKGLPTEQPPPAEKKEEPPKRVMVKHEEDESELFLRSMSDVKRLKPKPPGVRKKETVAPAPVMTKVDDREKQLFLQSVKTMDVRFEDEIPGVEPIRPAGMNRMRQLKSGAIRIDLELDLHGMTREEAIKSMAQFITGAYNRGQKAVLIITGKGNNSPGDPVLQGAVVSWLRETGKKMVAEFAPAPQQLGGSGALVVFLKDKNKAGTKDKAAAK